jgi:hypothetical protein
MDPPMHIYLQVPVLMIRDLLEVAFLVAQNLEVVVLAVDLVLMEHQVLCLTLVSVHHLIVHSVVVILLALAVQAMKILVSEDHHLVHLIPT